MYCFILVDRLKMLVAKNIYAYKLSMSTELKLSNILSSLINLTHFQLSSFVRNFPSHQVNFKQLTCRLQCPSILITRIRYHLANMLNYKIYSTISKHHHVIKEIRMDSEDFQRYVKS